MSVSYISGGARVVDGVGTLSPIEAKWAYLEAQNARLTELTIDPLEAGWSTPLKANHFRSGCAPLDALAHADTLIRENLADAVLIRGTDLLRSRYASDKDERQRLMSIYGDEVSIPEAYTQLAYAWMRRHEISNDDFKLLAAALFENYMRTAKRDPNFQAPSPHFYRMVTELFRAVDCANPVIDFSGAVLVVSEALRDDDSIEVLAVEAKQTEFDGPSAIEELACYDHLQEVCRAVSARAGINISEEFQRQNALLEAYTCFPVVPLGFLFASGIAQGINEIPSILEKHEITVTGGMNLARAPWNNPALNALIVMIDRLRQGQEQYGILHGNGGLGYRQGIAILRH